MKLSIVTTLYKSAPYIEEFHRRAGAAARQLAGEDYEIIVVNDGSPENDFEIAACLAANDPHMKVVDLSRNFGHHRAIMIGIEHSSGDIIFLLDVDLEESPELLSQFFLTLVDTKADSVYGVQETRKGGIFKRWSGAAFYRLFNVLSHQRIPSNKISATIMTRHFANALLQHRERNVYLAGIIALTGFKQVPLVCEKTYKGKTTYNLRRQFDQFVNAITGFSSKPLYYIFYLGLCLFIFSVLFCGYIIFTKLFTQNYLEGWTSLMAVISIYGSLIMMSIGIIGIFLSKIFDEIKNRPYAIIRKKINFD